jgi:hypothetical protein
LRGLKARNNILVSQFAKSSSFKAAIIVFTEYILVLAAVANVVTASYYMGFWTVSSFSCTSTYLPALWVTFSVFIHLGGMLALTLRTESGWNKKTFSYFMHHEFKLCIRQDQLVLKLNDEGYRFVLVSWITSVEIVTHLFFGIITLSSLTFIGKTTP